MAREAAAAQEELPALALALMVLTELAQEKMAHTEEPALGLALALMILAELAQEEAAESAPVLALAPKILAELAQEEAAFAEESPTLTDLADIAQEEAALQTTAKEELPALKVLSLNLQEETMHRSREEDLEVAVM